LVFLAVRRDNAQDVAVADFDEDGKLDLVVTRLDPDSESAGPELLRGDGKGGFSE
jgi:hypothetical protein